MTDDPSSLHSFVSLRYAAPTWPVTRQFSQRAAALLAWPSHHLRIHPNALTITSLVVGLMATIALSQRPSTLGDVLVIAVLLQFQYVIDCADGMVARSRKLTSALGGWLDLACDAGIAVAISLAAFQIVSATSIVFAFLAGFIFAGGRVSLLLAILSARNARSHGAHQRPPAAFPSIVGWLLRIALDTPVMLLAIAFAALEATLLSIVLCIYGLAATAQAWYLVRRQA